MQYFWSLIEESGCKRTAHEPHVEGGNGREGGAALASPQHRAAAAFEILHHESLGDVVCLCGHCVTCWIRNVFMRK
jgi:hypothetical protein